MPTLRKINICITHRIITLAHRFSKPYYGVWMIYMHFDAGVSDDSTTIEQFIINTMHFCSFVSLSFFANACYCFDYDR